nr:DegV family protein [Maliibacterium massiliense]
MAVRIITDSTSDIPKELAAQWDVQIVPLRVIFGDTVYVDGVSITREEFYAKMRQADQLPSTSQINPMEFEAVFRKALEAGDEVVGIFLSSELSGTYQSAALAKDTIGSDKIHVVDSRAVTMMLYLLVQQAVVMRGMGKGAAEIAQAVQEMIPHAHLYAAIGDLKHLQRGGRLSSVGVALGSVLKLCPLISMDGGKISVVSAARGNIRGFKWIFLQMEKLGVRAGTPLIMGNTDAPQLQQKMLHALGKKAQQLQILPCDIGAAVGVHAGPGCGGIAWIDAQES